MSFGTANVNVNWPCDTASEPLNTTLERSVNTKGVLAPLSGLVSLSLQVTVCSASLTVAVSVPSKSDAVRPPSRMRPFTTTDAPAPSLTGSPAATATPLMLSTTASSVGSASFMAGSPSSVNCSLFTVTSPPKRPSTRCTLARRAASPTGTRPSATSSTSVMKAMFMFSL